MKKLSLNSLTYEKGEVLTRTQLKKVLGGFGSDDWGGGSGGDKVCPDTCGGSLPECDKDLTCKAHAVYECSNEPLGCYLH